MTSNFSFLKQKTDRDGNAIGSENVEAQSSTGIRIYKKVRRTGASNYDTVLNIGEEEDGITWSDARMKYLTEYMKKHYGVNFEKDMEADFFNFIKKIQNESTPKCAICLGILHDERECPAIEKICSVLELTGVNYLVPYVKYLKHESSRLGTEFNKGFIEEA